MQTLKTVITTFDILFILIFLYSFKGLSWKRKEHKSSIVGITSMILLYFANIALIWW